MSKTYGDVMYLNVMGQPVVIVNTLRHATELLDKKAANLSSRPESAMFQLLGLNKYMVFMPYGRSLREHRRAFRGTYGPDAIAQWQPVQLKTARTLLRRLLASPKDFLSHLNLAIAETSMRVSYGIELKDDGSDREYYEMVERVRRIAEPLLHPGAYIMQAFPFLLHLPSWLPGLHIKRNAMEQRRDIDAITDKLYTVAATADENGSLRDSMVARILAAADTKDVHAAEVREMGRTLTAVAYVAGSDTTHAIMEALFLAMAMHPDKQRQAQQELDAAVGSDRLPTFSDVGSLPYLRAVVKETLRWHTILPAGLPHVALADDEYEGYYIPAGTVVNQNIWAMSKDEREYPDPHAFVPERFLPSEGNPPARDPAEYVFGFGRRVCPGRSFAEASLSIYCASVLHVFDILPPLDEHGRPVEMQYRPTDDMVS
ncbi:cytochrome P450 [Dichomitus squalens]|nr:cytochrome P450 [Dichomitus squalens]